MLKYITHNPEETQALGEHLAQKLKPGSIVAFTGDLGSGKTTFISGLAAGLHIEENITSPTFTIVNEYEDGTLPLFHFDMYRLQSEDELFDIGWDDYLRRDGVCAVEWTENISDAIDSDVIRVSLLRGDNDNVRFIEIEGVEL